MTFRPVSRAATGARSTRRYTVDEKLIRGALIALLAFVAVTTLVGAFLVVPTLPTEWMRWGPFADYTVPAIALGMVGVLAAAAALGVVSTPHLGALASIPAGLGIVLFEIVEVAVVGIALIEFPNELASWLQPFYIAVGIAIIALGAMLYRRYSPSAVLVTG
jgi:hypothetical protein